MEGWQDKVVLVTGGSAGLGKEIASAFVEARANVVISARREEPLRSAAAELSDETHPVFAVPADVTREEDVRRLIDAVVERHQRIDVLVNNVGRSDRGTVLEASAEKLRQLWEINFLSTALCTQAAAAHLRTSRGMVINIGSLSAKTASPFMGAYPTSKFPVDAYSQQLRFELEPDGVHVLLVCTGPLKRDDAGRRYSEQAEGLPDGAALPGGGVKLGAVDPRQLAQRILRAASQRRAELIVPGRAKLLLALARLFPRLADSIVLRSTRRK